MRPKLSACFTLGSSVSRTYPPRSDSICPPLHLDMPVPSFRSLSSFMEVAATSPATKPPAEVTKLASVIPNRTREGTRSQARDEISASSESGGAPIRNELLGNGLLEQDSVHDSKSSFGSYDDGEIRSDQQEVSAYDEELEQRLSHSSIAHSLRHIALAFDEKVSTNLPSTDASGLYHNAQLELDL